MKNQEESNKEDIELVKKILDGDRVSLDQLIRKHEPFIYNVAWKMTWDESDAKDITQEVLIKVITKLTLFKGTGSFRGWLYRIVANEFMDTKRITKEKEILGFDDFETKLSSIPDMEVSEEESEEMEAYTREVNLRCMSGMIMCLNREQRLLFVLGDLFGIDHNLGAEIFNVSRQNFRVKLHRARTEINNFVTDKCGLLNPDNPCRCHKKAKAMKNMGVLNENTFKFNTDYKSKIADYAENTMDEAIDTVDSKYLRFLRDQPAKDEFDSSIVVELIKDKGFWSYFE
jgi:RNA polymerase sigma factor (sigma-70 family)